jgi:4-alpha-glucanotransferase
MTHPLLARRSAGVLVHPTSLPGPWASGDLGRAAFAFVDFLREAGMLFWQMLPIHPVGAGDSPYDSPSAFAGAPHLISIERIEQLGLLSAAEVARTATPGRNRANISLGLSERQALLRTAHSRFDTAPQWVKAARADFEVQEGPWLWDYALFMALRGARGNASWVTLPDDLRTRQPGALESAHREFGNEVSYRVFEQFVFDLQWRELRKYAAEAGVAFIGDVPMFVAHDSVDVWANQHMFFLNERGERIVQAGVPPDYFTADGQLWGNPLYRWDAMRHDGFGWWIDRLRRELRRFDVMRLDHFIAFHNYWEVAVPAPNAKNGRYIEVPGYEFFERCRGALGGLPFIAEDLGIVTHEVERLRDHFELPGMKVLQFAFAPGADGYLPYAHPTRAAVYTGTHDNDTTVGCLSTLAQNAAENGSASAAAIEWARIRNWTGTADPFAASNALVRSLMQSPANLAVVPIQDLLMEGSDQRMNVPGTASGNWGYRMATDAPRSVADQMRGLLEVTGRWHRTA